MQLFLNRLATARCGMVRRGSIGEEGGVEGAEERRGGGRRWRGGLGAAGASPCEERCRMCRTRLALVSGRSRPHAQNPPMANSSSGNVPEAFRLKCGFALERFTVSGLLRFWVQGLGLRVLGSGFGFEGFLARLLPQEGNRTCIPKCERTLITRNPHTERAPCFPEAYIWAEVTLRAWGADW